MFWTPYWPDEMSEAFIFTVTVWFVVWTPHYLEFATDDAVYMYAQYICTNHFFWDKVTAVLILTDICIYSEHHHIFNENKLWRYFYFYVTLIVAALQNHQTNLEDEKMK